MCCAIPCFWAELHRGERAQISPGYYIQVSCFTIFFMDFRWNTSVLIASGLDTHLDPEQFWFSLHVTCRAYVSQAFAFWKTSFGMLCFAGLCCILRELWEGVTFSLAHISLFYCKVTIQPGWFKISKYKCSNLVSLTKQNNRLTLTDWKHSFHDFSIVAATLVKYTTMCSYSTLWH